jgi:2,4-dienoyl-CoA reductase-like NADH-dependent reductase (Old Yellow Enzyme family)
LGAKLYSEFAVRGVRSRNRIMVSPMCQYSARDGMANDYHLVHLGRFALGGAGIIMFEATAVETRGRITSGDLGLWSDEQIAPLRRITDFLRLNGAVPGIQLGHAGRKASTQAPWKGHGPITEADRDRGDLPWPVVGPSAISAGPDWQTPHALTEQDMDAIVGAWVDAARRADLAGFDIIDFHGAHGYLLHSFLSPLCNHRTDRYGGSLENRMRFPLRVAEAVRRQWPEHKATFYRLSVVDGLEGGWKLEDSEAFCRELYARGVDVIDVSSGGPIADRSSDARIRRTYGFHAAYSGHLRRVTGGLVATVGLIVEGTQAEAILQEGEADIIAVGREFQNDPNWALHARAQLLDDGFDDWPPQSGWWLNKRATLLARLRESGEHPLHRYEGGAKEAARYPLHLLSDQPACRLHSQLGASSDSLAGKVTGRESAYLSYADAEARRIRTGDLVELFNERGRLVAGAVITEGIMQGVVRISTGAWLNIDLQTGVERHGNPNVLTPNVGASYLSMGCASQSCLVDVRKWDGDAPVMAAHQPPEITSETNFKDSRDTAS